MEATSLNDISFTEIEEIIINYFQSHNFSESTIAENRRILLSVKSIAEGSIDDKRYSKALGEKWISMISDAGYSKCYIRHLKKMIYRMNDILDDKLCMKRHVTPKPDVVLEYVELYNDYLSYLKAQKYAEETIRSRETNARYFFNNLSKLGCHSASRINSEIVCKISLMSSSATYPTTIRSILKYLLDREVIIYDYSSLIRRAIKNQPIPSVYTKEEIREIENQPNTFSNIGKRNKAIILLATRNGMRKSNIANLKCSEIDFDNDIMHFRQVKTYNYINPVLLPDVKSALWDYINNARPIVDMDYVFVTAVAPFKQMHPNGIYGVIRKAIEGSGIPVKGRKCGPHAMRSSLNSAAVNNGLTYDEMRVIDGHRNPNAIYNYVRLADSKLRDCSLEVMPPSGNFAKLLYSTGKVE